MPRLHLIDLAGLENVRRFAVQHGVGVVLTGATLLQHDMDVLRAVWPELATREHPYPTRKIKQLAVVIVKESAGLRSVLTSENRLVTAPLERFDGLGLLFCSRRKIATSLFEAVCLTQPTARLAVENYEQMQCRKTVHHLADPKTYITYSRGVLGLGANLLNVRHVLADANAFRKLAAFTPGILGPEAFARARAEERTALILQNLGRALRGEEGKTAVLFLLNTDGHLLKVLKDSAALREGAELPIVWAQGDNLTQLVDQAERWLEADGGEWPGEDPRKDRKRGRPKSSAIRTREQILEAAEWALAEGMSWRDFSRKEHPQRHLTADELEALKARFGARNANNPEPTTGAGPGSDGDSACSP